MGCCIGRLIGQVCGYFESIRGVGQRECAMGQVISCAPAQAIAGVITALVFGFSGIDGQVVHIASEAADTDSGEVPADAVAGINQDAIYWVGAGDAPQFEDNILSQCHLMGIQGRRGGAHADVQHGVVPQISATVDSQGGRAAQRQGAAGAMYGQGGQRAGGTGCAVAHLQRACRYVGAAAEFVLDEQGAACHGSGACEAGMVAWQRQRPCSLLDQCACARDSAAVLGVAALQEDRRAFAAQISGD